MVVKHQNHHKRSGESHLIPNPPNHPSCHESLLGIILRARLGRQFQGLGRILLGHEQLYELEFARGRELPVVEQIFGFLFRFDAVGFAVVGRAAEGGDEVRIVPLGDVVVGGVEAVDVAFDGVAFVVDQEAGVVLAAGKEVRV